MNYMESQQLFIENSVKSRLLCIKDFLKQCAALPLILIIKACKTFFRGIGVCFGALFVTLTLGLSEAAREFFSGQVVALAKDFAEWLLLPFIFISRLIKLLLALFVHPNFY